MHRESAAQISVEVCLGKVACLGDIAPALTCQMPGRCGLLGDQTLHSLLVINPNILFKRRKKPCFDGTILWSDGMFEVFLCNSVYTLQSCLQLYLCLDGKFQGFQFCETVRLFSINLFVRKS